MSFNDLSEFVSRLEDLGELARISVEVDPLLEIAEITDRVCRDDSGGKSLFFENVRGTTIPVVTNLLGSERRICLALRSETLDDAAERISHAMRPELPEGWLGSLKLLPQLAQMTRLPPKVVKSGLSQQVVKVGRDVDLRELPIPQSRPSEAGPSMTSGQIFTANPETGLRDVSMGILALQGKSSLSILWNSQEDGWRNFAAYRKQGRQMPVAVVLGGDPALLIAASTPLPRDTDECLIAGFLRGSAVELVKARSIPLQVPAVAEIVIEGLIDTDRDPVQSGPVALPTGFYSDVRETPLLDVTAVTHRANPLFPAMVHGMPPTESLHINRAVERLLLPVIQTFLPEIVDFHRPSSGASRNLLFVRIRKEYPQQARKVMSALWGMSRFSMAKFIVVVDEDVDVRDESQVWFHVASNVHPGRDTVPFDGPTHDMDHAAPIRGIGRKLGLDATRKGAEEGHPRSWPEQLLMTQQIQNFVSRRWNEYGL